MIEKPIKIYQTGEYQVHINDNSGAFVRPSIRVEAYKGFGITESVIIEKLKIPETILAILSFSDRKDWSEEQLEQLRKFVK